MNRLLSLVTPCLLPTPVPTPVCFLGYVLRGSRSSSIRTEESHQHVQQVSCYPLTFHSKGCTVPDGPQYKNHAPCPQTMR